MQMQGQPGMGGIMDLFKMQVLMKYMDQAKSPQMSFLFMIFMMFYEHASKNIPALGLIAYAYLSQFLKKPPQNLIKPASEPPKSKMIRAFIQFERDATQKVVDPRIDAVMNFVCNLQEVRSLRFNGQEFIPNFTESLLIDNDIWFEIIQNAPLKISVAPSSQNQTQPVSEPIVYKLSCYDHDITYLHRFVEQSISNYEQEKKNKLGSEMYYFDQVVSIGGGKMKMPVPNGFCAFRKSKFQSNRSLDNVYIKQIEELKGRVEFFLRRRDWYDAKGIPHTLGIMMWGHPGCGKTSTIKAVSNETKRHIFNINLSEIKTKDALKDLFYNDVVHVFNNDKLEQLTIPLKQRLYVIEDVDAMNSVVIKRSMLEVNEKKKKEDEKKRELLTKLGREEEIDNNELDLATLLNVLDGVRETPGRIIILSTNYPERLDEALLRPGRFDIMLEFEKHGRSVVRMHVEKYYDITLSAKQYELLDDVSLEKKWTPAEVSQILFKNIHSVDAAIDDLRSKEPHKLFRFSQVTYKNDEERLVEERQIDTSEETSETGETEETGSTEKKEDVIEKINQTLINEGKVTEAMRRQLIEEGRKLNSTTNTKQKEAILFKMDALGREIRAREVEADSMRKSKLELGAKEEVVSENTQFIHNPTTLMLQRELEPPGKFTKGEGIVNEWVDPDLDDFYQGISNNLEEKTNVFYSINDASTHLSAY